jgi:glycosyltransferase involved in cell wall biosynthesis
MFSLLRYPPSPGLISFVNRRAGDFDLILGHMVPYGTVTLAARAARRHGRRLVLLPLMHVDDDFYHWNSYYRAFKQADLILANSQYAVDHLYRPLGANAVAIGPGVDPSEFDAARVSGARFRQAHGLHGIPLVLYVGRKSLLKRYDLLIEAVDLVNRQLPCKLVIVGPDEDRVPITSPHVIALGPVSRSDLIDAYDACDVFGMMSESESFGMVFLEAWMRKKPVIGNRRCGPVATLIEDGMNGYLCETAAQCADRIAGLLRDPSHARAMGENGYRTVLERFTWDQIGKRVLSHYRTLLDLSRAGC